MTDLSDLEFDLAEEEFPSYLACCLHISVFQDLNN